jgi:hypothetical protein
MQRQEHNPAGLLFGVSRRNVDYEDYIGESSKSKKEIGFKTS